MGQTFLILKWSTDKIDLVSGCLGLLARMNTAFFTFHLVILAGKNLFKTKANAFVGDQLVLLYLNYFLVVYNGVRESWCLEKQLVNPLFIDYV